MKQKGINFLSRKEVELIDYIRKGYSPSEIAGILNSNVKKIELYQQSITRKLSLKNTVALDNYIVRCQLELEERCAI